MQTHIVPVGFDYDRLIAPLSLVTIGKAILEIGIGAPIQSFMAE